MLKCNKGYIWLNVILPEGSRMCCTSAMLYDPRILLHLSSFGTHTMHFCVSVNMTTHQRYDLKCVIHGNIFLDNFMWFGVHSKCMFTWCSVLMGFASDIDIIMNGILYVRRIQNVHIFHWCVFMVGPFLLLRYYTGGDTHISWWWEFYSKPRHAIVNSHFRVPSVYARGHKCMTKSHGGGLEFVCYTRMYRRIVTWQSKCDVCHL